MRHLSRITVACHRVTVTGNELRAAIADAGLTPNQFVERMAHAMAATGATTLDNARRTAKRWLSARKAEETLLFSQRNRELVALVLEVDGFALVRSRAQSRLEELAEAVAEMQQNQRQLLSDLAETHRRLELLEAERDPQRAAPRARRKRKGA